MRSLWLFGVHRCVSPAGQGTSFGLLIVVDYVLSAPTSLVWNYLPPSIRSLSPTASTAKGGHTLSIHGTNFGAAGTVTVGGRTCDVSYWAQGLLNCTVPFGATPAAVVTVTVAGQSNPELPLLNGTAADRVHYLPPVLLNPSLAMLSTAGGEALTIAASNTLPDLVTVWLTLYEPTEVQADPFLLLDGASSLPCDVTFANDTIIQCTTPPGENTDWILLIVNHNSNVNEFESSSLLVSQDNHTTLDYYPPVITLIRPVSSANDNTSASRQAQAPAIGGFIMLLLGSNFSSSSTVSVLGVPTAVLSATYTSLLFASPPRIPSLDNTVVLNAGSQASAPILIPFDPPVITAVYPNTFDAVDSSTRSALRIQGVNFCPLLATGSNRPNHTVTVGECRTEIAVPCKNVFFVGLCLGVVALSLFQLEWRLDIAFFGAPD